MRIGSLLDLSENHRFYTYRDFSLSPLDRKMIALLYQPMIGAEAAGLYASLDQGVPAEKLGYSGLELLRTLFLSLGLEPGDKGRQRLADGTSKLEAVGLLQTSRKYEASSEDVVYEFRLFQPLAPSEFFRNQHLTMLLRDKIGKYAVLAMQEQFYAPEPTELLEAAYASEDVSVPFYELFRLSAEQVDRELDQALHEMAPSRLHQAERRPQPAVKGFDYAELISHFPRQSRHRASVEQFRHDPAALDALSYSAGKYFLTLKETAQLLDEDGIFDADGRFDAEAFQRKANELYRYNSEREGFLERKVRKLAKAAGPAAEAADEQAVDPAYHVEVPGEFAGQCDAHQYNFILRNEPYTHILQRFHPGQVPPTTMDIFEQLDMGNRLPEPVINVLLHHIYGIGRIPLNQTYINKVVSDMLAKRVATYEQAVEFFRRQQAKPETAPGRTYGGRGNYRNGRNKPKVPIITEDKPADPISGEELERILAKARRLEDKRVK